MRIDTEEPEEEELSEHEQDPLSGSEDEPDPADAEATPTQDPKGKRPEVVIQHPTLIKPIAILDTREEKEEQEALALIDSMFSIYHFHKPNGPRFKPTSQGLSALAKEITKLAQELPKKPIPGQFPVIPQKPTQRVPTPVIPPTAPQRARGDPSILSKLCQGLKDTYLPTMFSNNPEPSRQSSLRLQLPPQQRVSHQRPTSVPLSQAKPINRPAFHWVELRPAPRPPSPPDTAWIPLSQQPQQQPPPPPEAAPPPSTPKNPKQVRMSAPLGSDPGDSDGSSSSSSEGDSNKGSGKASSRGRRSRSMGSTTSSVFGSSKLKGPKLEKNNGSSNWNEAAVFDNWVNDTMNILEVGELDPEARQAMIWLGWHLEGEAKILHASYRKNPETKNSTVPEFLKVLRKFCVPFISNEKLSTEFQAIRQTQNGRTKPIQQVANKIKQLQILLPNISDWQCYNQLLEAMDPALLHQVSANINDEMEWNDLIELCSKHDSVIHKHTSIKKDYKSKNGQKMRQQNHTPQASSNPAPTNMS